MAPDLREAQQQQDGGAARPRSFGSPVSESVPVPGPPTPVQRTARWLLALAGWSVDLPWPPEPRGIIVVYPHTSNWDFVVGILALLATGLPAQWVARDTALSLALRMPAAVPWRHPSEPARAHRLHRA